MATKSFSSPACLGLLSTTSFGLIQFLVIAIYPALSQAVSLSLSSLILSFSIGSLLFIWSAPYWAIKSDELGRQKILSIGLIGLALSFSIIVLLTELTLSTPIAFTLLIMSRLIYGLTASAIVSVVQAWWRDQSGDVSKNMLTHSMGLNLGRFLAPLIILMLGGNLRYILWALLLWIILLCGLSFINNSIEKVKISVPEIDSSGYFTYPVILAFLSTIFLGTIHSTLAYQLGLSFEMTVTDISILSSKVLLLSSGLVLMGQFLLRKLNLRGLSLLWTGIISWFIFSLLFIKLDSLETLWLAIFFLSIGISTITPGYLSIMRAGGKTSGYISATQTLGLALGGLIGFLIIQKYLTLDLPLFIFCILLLAITLNLKFKEKRCAAC